MQVFFSYKDHGHWTYVFLNHQTPKRKMALRKNQKCPLKKIHVQRKLKNWKIPILKFTRKKYLITVFHFKTARFFIYIKKQQHAFLSCWGSEPPPPLLAECPAKNVSFFDVLPKKNQGSGY